MALTVADLEETEDGFKIVIRKSKTDQEGHGETIAIVRGGASCPVKAVKAWLPASACTASESSAGDLCLKVLQICHHVHDGSKNNCVAGKERNPENDLRDELILGQRHL